MIPHTQDTMLAGAVHILQPRGGERFSVDAVQLADFAQAHSFRNALDLGSGTGIIAFLLAHAAPRAKVTALEIDAELVELASAAAARNQFGERVRIVPGDLRNVTQLVGKHVFDLVVANPPFHPKESGRPSPNPARAQARHELSCDLEDVLRAARLACAPRGRINLILPVERLLEAHAVAPKELRFVRARFVHSHADRPARRVLLEARRGGREPLAILAPLIVHDGMGGYSPEMKLILGEL